MKNITILIFIMIFSTISFAQNNQEAKNEFMIWAGGSPDSTELIGSTKNARLGTIGLRYARIFNPSKDIALKYTADFIPTFYLSYPKNIRERKSNYGLGIAPLGLQVNFRRQKKIQTFVSASGGFIAFTKKVPNENGAKFNFTAEIGGGFQVMLKNKKAVTFGYKYHHLSNGYRANFNPGFDSNIFYVGFSFFK